MHLAQAKLGRLKGRKKGPCIFLRQNEEQRASFSEMEEKKTSHKSYKPAHQSPFTGVTAARPKGKQRKAHRKISTLYNSRVFVLQSST